MGECRSKLFGEPSGRSSIRPEHDTATETVTLVVSTLGRVPSSSFGVGFADWRRTDRQNSLDWSGIDEAVYSGIRRCSASFRSIQRSARVLRRLNRTLGKAKKNLMKIRLNRFCRAVVIGLAWALAWAPVAVLIGTQIVDPDDTMDEMWLAVGVIPGFLCGVVFVAVLGIAAGRYRLREAALSRVVACGAASGLMIGLLPLAVGTPSHERPLWYWAAVIIGSMTLLSAVSAMVSAMLARMVANRELPHNRGTV